MVIASLVVGSITPASATPLGPAAGHVPVQSSDSGTAGAGSVAGPDAEVLVVDFNGLDSIRRFALDGTATGSFDEADDILGSARAIEVGPDGLAYVAGADTGRVVRYNPADGSLVDVVVDTDAGLENPRALAFDGDGNLLVASSGTDEVVAFDPDSGERLMVVAAEGLDNPGDMIVDADGVLWVTSQNTDSIIGYNSEGDIETELDTGPGSGPVDLTLGPGGVFFVAMADRGRVDVVTLPVERPGLLDTDAVIEPFITDGLVTPTAVTIGPDEALWVADHWSGTIGRFDATTGADLGFEPGSSDDGATDMADKTDQSMDASFGPTDLVFFLPIEALTEGDVRDAGTDSGQSRRFVASVPADRAFAVTGTLYDAVVRSTGATVSTARAEIGFEVVGAAANTRGRFVAASRRGDPADPGVDDVWFDQVLPGVDLVWTSDGEELEYSFVLEPGIDPGGVRVNFLVDNGVWVDVDGNAVLGDSGLVSSTPVVYQDTPEGRMEIDSRYLLFPDGTVGFFVDGHDSTLPLVIDPTFRTAGSASSGGGSSITIPKPAGTTAGDVLLASVAQPTSSAVTPPAGWTAIRSDGSASVQQDLFYRVAGASEPASYVFTTGASAQSAGAVVAYSDVDTTQPVNAHSGQANGTSTSYVAPSLATTVDGATLVGFFAHTSGGGINPPAGMTERVDQGSVDGATEIADEILGAAGSTGTRTATGPSSVNVGQLVALTPATLGRWRFDEGSASTTLDSSGAGHDGTITGATYVTGVSSTALDFTGNAGERVVVGDPVGGSLDPGTGDFTVSAWFRTSVLPGGSDFDQLVYKSDGSEGYELFLVNDGGTTRLTWRARDAGSSWTTLIVTPLDDGSWHHAAGVIDGTDLHLYLDGVLVDSTPYGGSDIDTTDFLTFGAEPDGLAWSDYEGDLDEISIYGRALSASEIAELASVAVTVNSTGDATDASPGDDVCDTGATNSQGAPECTLRAAIQEANASGIISTIDFAMPTTEGGHSAGVWTISPGSGLPTISAQTTIDGTTQTGWVDDPIVRVDGNSAGSATGLTFGSTSDGSTLDGLMITRFSIDGVYVSTGADGVTVTRSWVGSDGSGLSTMGNGDDGIDINGINAVVTDSVVNHNSDEGIDVRASGATITATMVGVEADGTSGAGNTDVGIAVFAGGTTIGGTGAGEGNVISLNWEGIEINSSNNIIQGNKIGTASDGTTNRGNDIGDGIEIQSGTGNLVGGTAPGAGNVIAFNQVKGVDVTGGNDNTVLGNTIHSNGGLGIDLGATGVTGNDAGDGDTGANDLLNFPVLTAPAGGITTLDVDLDVPAGNYRIEVFTNPTVGADPSGYGEGETLVHAETITHSGSGVESFTLTGLPAWTAGDVVTATTTEDLGAGAHGATSELSQSVAASAAATTVTFQQGTDGYGGAVDTFVAADFPDTDQGANVELQTDASAVAQGLVRFEGIVGNGAGQIPPGSTVTSASLTLNNRANPSQPGAVLAAHRMLTSWLSSSTWNTLGSGVQLDGVEAEGTADGSTTTNIDIVDGTVVVNGLEDAVQAWVDGAANHGWVLTLDNNDGWDGHSADGPTVALRPTLTVTYGYSPVVVNSTGDGADATPGDTLCDTGGTNSEGADECTLRAAIEEANASGGATIHFDIPTSDPGYSASPLSYTLTPATPYALITSPTILDATTQTGYSGDPIVELDGTGAVGASGGLILRSNDSTIRGFAVHSYVDEGLEIDGSTGFGDNNTIQNNWVGLDAAGTVQGNGDHGILVTVDALDNLIGGTGANDGNVVAGSTSIGILVRTNSTGNAVLGNSVYSNGGLGLDLDEDGVTANDAGDPDTGSNDLLNFPVITSAGESGGTVTVTFDLDVPANPGGYRVEFFTNPGGADPSGNGEGEQIVSAATVSPGTGLTHNFAGSTGDIITATATAVDSGAASGYGSTSEYSAAVTVGVASAVPPTTVTFRQGSNGYTGTVDTWISSNVANQDNSADPLLQIDNSPVQHGLIRFDGIIGAGADQIPSGATIISADLTFEAADPSAADASLHLYRVLRSWVETDTWNSLSSGISTDDVEARSTPDAVHTGGLDLTNTPITIIGLEAAVQAWVDGDANQGWLLTLDRTNGWDAQSSENADTVGRPTLSVTYLVGPVTHVVNSTGDGTDANPGDAVCDTGGTNSGGDPECTLRAAIAEANAISGADIIEFAIPATEAGHSAGVWTISPGSALATLSDTVTIDGSTQPGWITNPVVELNGTAAGASTDGFRITADNVTIRSLAINRFAADGIEAVSGAANALIAGSHIGVDASGTIARGNGGRGIDLGTGSGPTTVGGTAAADRNVISGNGANGIIVWNSNNNVIIGNHLGTDVTGNLPLGNGSDGVTLGGGSAGNTIGQPGAGNVLSGNANDGFENDATGANNLVQANIIGLGADGDTPVPNGRYGVVIYNGANNTTIGGGGVGEGNVISGNVQSGVIIDGAGNPATTGNVVASNMIGTDATGLVDRGNGTHGVHFFAGATGNTIGGPTAADGNVISGNGSGQAGILITGSTTSANVVQHNYIGVNGSGTAAIANNLHGLHIDGAPDTQVLDNLISGNDVHGVYVFGVGATGTQILRNSLGVNAAQTATIPNLFDGVRLEGNSSGTIVGTSGNGNVIGGNADHGVNINSSNGNSIQANHFGTDTGGSVDLGNTGAGVYSDAFDSSNNLIGGATAGEGNVIAFNGVGIQLDSGDDNSILGNLVYSNHGLGIDLGGDGVTPNDAGDGDPGSNDQLNYPIVLPPLAGVSKVAIDLDVPAGDHRIEIFANPTDGADASGHGEGETILGATTVTHAGSGVQRFVVPLGTALVENDVLAATTTEDLGGGSYGSTSEFAASVTVGPPALTVNSSGDSPDNDPGDGYCYTGAVNSEGDPECTLRAAIAEVNALGVFNVDTGFAIPTSDAGYLTAPRPHWTITPASSLPAVAAYHDLDATTQTGWAALAPVVYLDGSTSAAINLFHYDTGSAYSLLDGLGIINAPANAIRSDVDYIYLSNLVVGVQVDGTTGAGSGGDAVVVNGQHGDLRDSVISAATGAGVRVTTAGSNFSATENYIGTGTDGTAALGNAGGGIIIDGGDNHVIGLGVRDANVIAHNPLNVQINGAASDIAIENNLIGVDLAGAGSAGSVPLEINTTGSVRVGGELSTEANTIRYGTAAGITVTGTATASIVGNSIFSDAGVGIDLGADGVTANDPGDGDTGPNELLNFPVLSVPHQGDSVLTATLDVPAGDYRIEVFTNPTEGADPTGYGEGETLVGAKTVTHTGSGAEEFTIVVPSVSLGQVYTATATRNLGGSPTAYGPTSEFSAAVTVASAKPVVLDSSVRRSDLTADGGLDPAVAETAGISGRALPFDGFGDRLEGPALNIADTALTVTARVRPDTLGGTSTLVSKRDSGGSPIYELVVNGAGQASATFGVGGAVTVSGGSVSAGSWHDVVATWDGADAVLYVDGVEVDRAAAAGSLAADIDTPVMIGNRSDGSAGFDGLIDHVDITHDPLIGTEVALRHANTVAGTLTAIVGQQQTGPPGPWTVTTGQSRSGTYALAAPVTPNSGSAAWAVAAGVDEPGVVFESWWWIDSTAGVDLSSGTRAGASATDQFDAAFIAGSDWALRRRFGATTDIDGAGTFAPSTGTWVKVEQWTDQNGNSRLLVDGTEVIAWTGQTSPPASGSVGFRVGQLPGGQFWFVDDPRARKLISPEPVATLGPLDRD